MSLSPEQQQTLSTFIAMTNADVPVAKAFLKATAWDMNTAMDRFFAFGGDASKLAPPANSNRVMPQPQPSNQAQVQPSLLSTTANIMQQAIGGLFGSGPVPLQPNNNNNNNSNNIGNGIQALDHLSQTDQDALLAQQLAQQQPQPSTASQQPFIRAPDSAYQERLVGPYTNQYGSSLHKQRRDAQQNFARDWQKGPRNDKSSFLGALFSDPSFKFVGSLEEAKKKGCLENKWVLINIQDTENFCSHCLNRDIWKDKELGPVVCESFIFYQWMKRTDNAKRVINLYHPYKFPCIFIIDPDTGRKEYEFIVPDSPDKINTLKPKLLEFLDDCPNPKAKPKGNMKLKQKQKQPNMTQAPQQNMSNDEKLLQQAIQESLQQSKKAQEAQQEEEEEKEQELEELEEKIEIKEVREQLEPQPDINDSNATAIRIRMPNGSILQRLFKKDAKVNQLYIWCTLSLNGQKISLIQTMPRLKLDDVRNKTLNELGLIRATLVCSYH